MSRRSRKDIQKSFDLPFLNPKIKRRGAPPLSEEEIKKLADKHGHEYEQEDITSQEE